MSDPFPAIAEAAATGPIADIFADIRRVLGVEMVNLIWRHLATLPEALPWAWGMLRPLYVNGTIAGKAKALHGQLELPVLPSFPPKLLAAADLTTDDLASIGNILIAYDRTNAMALVALSALLHRLDVGPSRNDPPVPRGPQREPAATIPLPPLPDLDGLSPPVRGLVLTLNRLGTRRENAVVASMYRHLAYWPRYLALGWALIAPLDANCSLDRAIDDALAKAKTLAEGLAPLLLGPSLETVSHSAIRSAVEPFAGDVLAKMVVICALLRRATQPQRFQVARVLPVERMFGGGSQAPVAFSGGSHADKRS